MVSSINVVFIKLLVIDYSIVPIYLFFFNAKQLIKDYNLLSYIMNWYESNTNF